MRKNNDIETALFKLLTIDGFSASAHSVPASLNQTLPHIHIVRTGGYTASLVVETHYIDFDVYDQTAADAMETTTDICGWVRDLVGRSVGTTCYKSEISTLPYRNPDPRHPTIARITFKAQITTRMKGA